MMSGPLPIFYFVKPFSLHITIFPFHLSCFPMSPLLNIRGSRTGFLLASRMPRVPLICQRPLSASATNTPPAVDHSRPSRTPRITFPSPCTRRFPAVCRATPVRLPDPPGATLFTLAGSFLPVTRHHVSVPPRSSRIPLHPLLVLHLCRAFAPFRFSHLPVGHHSISPFSPLHISAAFYYMTCRPAVSLGLLHLASAHIRGAPIDIFSIVGPLGGCSVLAICFRSSSLGAIPLSSLDPPIPVRPSHIHPPTVPYARVPHPHYRPHVYDTPRFSVASHTSDALRISVSPAPCDISCAFTAPRIPFIPTPSLSPAPLLFPVRVLLYRYSTDLLPLAAMPSWQYSSSGSSPIWELAGLVPNGGALLRSKTIQYVPSVRQVPDGSSADPSMDVLSIPRLQHHIGESLLPIPPQSPVLPDSYITSGSP
jgi:hypothetical protein